MPDAYWKEIKSIYSEAGRYFGDVERRLRKQKKCFYGFKILNAPPLAQPEYLFVGYQPGGGHQAYAHELSLETHKKWPDEPEYVTAKWHLADRMKEIFPHDILMRSMGLNAIFLRWPRVGDYKTSVPSEMHEDIASFCRKRIQKIIEIVQPQQVVTIGFSTLDLFGAATTPDLRSGSGRVLTRTGTVCGREAIGMLHLTGCRISKEDRVEIRRHLLAMSRRPSTN
jgi:hypothetical protein